MRVGAVFFFSGAAREVSARWRLGESVGLGHGWVFDHQRWSGSDEPGWYSAFPLLALGCAATSRMTLGTLVSPPASRSPAALAQDALTLDRLADGRFVLGLGAGTGGADAELSGIAWEPLPARRRRFAEYVELTARFIAGQQVEFQGEFFTVSGSLPWGAASGRPLMAVAGHDEKAIDLAVRHAGVWVSNGPRPFRTQRARLDLGWVRDRHALVSESCAARGRPLATLRRLFLLAPRGSPCLADAGYVVGLAGELADIGFTDIVCPFPAENSPYQIEVGVLEKLVEAFAGD